MRRSVVSMSELSETFKHLESDPQGGSQHLFLLLEGFVKPFLVALDGPLDSRLVRTLLQCLLAIIRLRNNPQALWLSELGSYLDGCPRAVQQRSGRHQAHWQVIALGQVDGGPD
jgi:hypothetical protein